MGSDGAKWKPCPQPIHLRDVRTGEVIAIPCKSWGCDSCSPKKRAELLMRLRVASHYLYQVYGDHARFLTLTLDPKRNRASAADGTQVQARYVAASWRRLISKWRERCRRRGIKPPWFFKTAEWRKRTGAMHLHTIFLGWIPSGSHLKQDIVEAGFGHVYDIQRVDSLERLTNYITKYITKLAQIKAPRYVNRYSYSRGGLPSMTLHKRLRMAGLISELEAAAAGEVCSLGEANTAWWTGEAVKKIEEMLSFLEAAALEGAEEREWRLAHTRPHPIQIADLALPP